MTKIQSIRGFNDIIDDIEQWQSAEQMLHCIADRYGYQEIRTPVLENAELFTRSIGVTSDIVHKEMYTFTDKNEQTIGLRPEGTASVVRACIEKNLLYNHARKWFYCQSMFRRERPQKGRLRQFHQFGMECLGFDEPYADIEQLAIIQRIMESAGIADKITLELNYLGSKTTRQHYSQALRDYYAPHTQSLSPLDYKRWQENVLRLLDTKAPELIAINQDAPTIDRFYTDAEASRFQRIQTACQALNINFVVNKKLMRGLDYYTGLIYEWKSEHLGAQATVCGGGRYDLLFENLGAKAESACGFSIGMERLLALTTLGPTPRPKIFILCATEQDLNQAMQISEQLRLAHPSYIFYLHLETGKINNLVKKAARQSASHVLICDHIHFGTDCYQIRDLNRRTQDAMSAALLSTYLEKITC